MLECLQPLENWLYTEKFISEPSLGALVRFTVGCCSGLIVFLGAVVGLLAGMKQLREPSAKSSTDAKEARGAASKRSDSGNQPKIKRWVLVSLLLVVVMNALICTELVSMRRKLADRRTPEGAAPDSNASLHARVKALEAMTQGLQGQPQQSPATKSEYKLLWFDHFRPGKLWEVTYTDPTVSEVRNDVFGRWNQTAFDSSKWIVKNQWLVAGDEQFKPVAGKEGDNWWTVAPYDVNVRLNKRWLEIMDDERWYVYEVVKANP